MLMNDEQMGDDQVPVATGERPPSRGCSSAPAVGVSDDVAAAGLAHIVHAIDELRGLPLSELSGEALLGFAADVETVARSLFGVQIRVAAELESRGLATDLGARGTAHLLSQRLHITVGDARARVAAGEAGLARLTPTGSRIDPLIPELLAAVDAGDIGADHARVITDCAAKIRTDIDPPLRDHCHAVLLSEAIDRDSNELRKVGEQIRLILDTDGTLPRPDPVDRAELTIGRLRADGLTPIRGLLDPLTCARLRTAVDHLSRPTPAHDGTPDPRRAEVRRAHAFGEVLHRYLRGFGLAVPAHAPEGTAAGTESAVSRTGTPPSAAGTDGAEGAAAPAVGNACKGGRAPNGTAAGGAVDPPGGQTGHGGGAIPRGGGFRPQIGITIRIEDFLRGSAALPGAVLPGAEPLRRGPSVDGILGHAIFDDGAPVSLETVRMLACDGDLIPLLIGANGAVLDQGRAIRRFTRAQRRALTVRDKGCAFPGCDIPAAWCDAHHITPWGSGGKSDLDNAVLLCQRHHSVIHHGKWLVERAEQRRARPWFVPPPFIDPNRKRLRNTHFHLPEVLAAVMRT